MKYNADEGEGFYIVQENDEFLNAYYIYDIVNSFNVYDATSNNFIKIQQKQQESVAFFLDFDYQTIDIFGNKTKCAKIINFLGKISNYTIRIDDVILDNSKIIHALVVEDIGYKINRIKIKDYQFFDSVLGDCTLNIENYSNVDWILEKYKDNITQFSINIYFENPTAFIFYKSGAISIYKDAKDVEIENLRFISKCFI